MRFATARQELQRRLVFGDRRQIHALRLIPLGVELAEMRAITTECLRGMCAPVPHRPAICRMTMPQIRQEIAELQEHFVFGEEEHFR